MVNFFVGIDVSKYKAHIVILDDKTHIYHCEILESREKKDIERGCTIKRSAEDFLIEFVDANDTVMEDLVVAIESPIYLQNIRTTLDIARNVFVIQTVCGELSIPCFGVDNRVWKKEVLGNGAAKKEDIEKFAKTKWKKYPFADQDSMDAACIAFHAALLFSNKKRK